MVYIIATDADYFHFFLIVERWKLENGSKLLPASSFKLLAFSI
jgi:hypothetical protein